MRTAPAWPRWPAPAVAAGARRSAATPCRWPRSAPGCCGAAACRGACPGPAQKSAGQTSRVVTDHLEVELDHDTGRIRGRVLKGFFAGRDLESLAPVEMAHLWQDCRFADPQSAQILETYLDHAHPTWREDMARQRRRAHRRRHHDARAGARHPRPRPGASEDDIRRAHRELMMKLHPDRGGSTFLAAKINEAKDVLLGKRS